MKLISRNAASQLFAKAHSLREQHTSWRCIYLRLADRRGVYSQQLIRHFFIEPINDMLEEYEGSIYLCEDGDIVILFQGLLAPVLDRFAIHFGDLNADDIDSGSNPLFNILDLSVGWLDFSTYCGAKLQGRLHKPTAAFAVYGKIPIAPHIAG